ncbi:unnamed protein product [Parascedosporium putredinis]|uniref:inositol-3-phosphate synthase n=1 Tax=Parascedosporium putredinis TaxID=1442378 RepID=A0A9P1GZ38_9PEZI|nr:unnamed protein product [Parascedosporium putredinis]CAI7991368.1 unnamed protein product [Parascedosporium putredinis]
MAPHAEIDASSANGSEHAASPSSAELKQLFTVNSPDVVYSDSEINSKYTYRTTQVKKDVNGQYVATPQKRLTWESREGTKKSNYYGSILMGSTMKLGTDAETSKDVNIPFHDVLPMVHPNDIVVGGWDISSLNLADAMDRAQVLEPTLKEQVRKEMATLTPLPSIYYPDFIAANQEDRADNLIPGTKVCAAHVETIRKQIQDFKSANNLDKVIVQWTANTERYADIIEGVNDTADNLLKAIEDGHEELAEKHKSYIGGDDFKSGQTKMKSALVDFLINAGIKLTSIASYNHLGNNDGKNLSSHKQFRSKEISKSNVVDDMVEANSVLYQPHEHPDHTVVIKYMPAVGDYKRALDEYYADIFMGGHQTISIFNWKAASSDGATTAEYKGFHPVLSILSYMLKAPMTPPGTPVINALAKQRAALTNIFRACVGLQPESEMTLEHKLF